MLLDTMLDRTCQTRVAPPPGRLPIVLSDRTCPFRGASDRTIISQEVLLPMASADIDILESPHAIGILLYVADHDGCRKMDVYNEVSHNSTMSRKIDSLEEAGLLEQRPMNRGLVIHLTDKGRRVSRLLADVRDALLSDGDAPSKRRTTFFASRCLYRRPVLFGYRTLRDERAPRYRTSFIL